MYFIHLLYKGYKAWVWYILKIRDIPKKIYEALKPTDKENLNEDQIKDLPKTDLIEQILSEYIGRKVMALEIEELDIEISDNALRNIIKNDKLFFKDNKFIIKVWIIETIYTNIIYISVFVFIMTDRCFIL